MSSKNTTQKDVAAAKEFVATQTPEEIGAKAAKEAEEQVIDGTLSDVLETIGSAEAEEDAQAEIDALAKTIFEQYDFDVIYITSDGSSAFETPELAASYDPDYVTVNRPA